MDSFKSNVVNHIRWVRLQEDRKHTADHIIGLERFISHEVTSEYQRRKNTHIREVLNHTVHDLDQAHKEDHHAARLARISAVNSLWARARARFSAMLLEDDALASELWV